MSFVAALAYHFCLNLPAAFTQPGARLLVEPCTVKSGYCEFVTLLGVLKPLVAFIFVIISEYFTLAVSAFCFDSAEVKLSHIKLSRYPIITVVGSD